jgi:hypothetical protein
MHAKKSTGNTACERSTYKQSSTIRDPLRAIHGSTRLSVRTIKTHSAPSDCISYIFRVAQKKRQQKSITRTFPVDACRSSISAAHLSSSGNGDDRPQAAAMGTRDTSRERSSPRADDAASSSSFRSSHSCPSFTPPASPRKRRAGVAGSLPVA